MINFEKLNEILATGETLTITSVRDDKGIYTVSVTSLAMTNKKITPVIVRGNAEELQMYFNTAFGETAANIKSFSSNASDVTKAMKKSSSTSVKADTKKPAATQISMSMDNNDEPVEDDDEEQDTEPVNKPDTKPEPKPEPKSTDLFSATKDPDPKDKVIPGTGTTMHTVFTVDDKKEPMNPKLAEPEPIAAAVIDEEMPFGDAEPEVKQTITDEQW